MAQDLKKVESPTSPSSEEYEMPTSTDPEEKKVIDALLNEIKDLKVTPTEEIKTEEDDEDVKISSQKKTSDVEMGSDIEKLLGEAVEATVLRKMPKAKDDPELKWLAVAVLRFRHYDIKSATDRLLSFLDWRIKNDVVHQDVTKDKKLQAQLREKVSRLLPTKDKQGRGIFWINLKNHNPTKYTAQDTVRCIHWLFLHALKNDPQLQKNGMVGINDLVGTSHRNLDINIPKALLPLFSKVFPVRLGGIYFVNPTAILQIVVPIAQRLSPKLAKRIHIYGTQKEKLLRNFDKEALPEELGGTLKFDYDSWLEKQFIKSEK